MPLREHGSCEDTVIQQETVGLSLVSTSSSNILFISVPSLFFTFRKKNFRSLSLEKLVRWTEAEPQSLGADNDRRLARSVETKAGRESSLRTSLGRVDGCLILMMNLPRPASWIVIETMFRARTLQKKRAVAAAARNSGQDERPGIGNRGPIRRHRSG